MYNTERLTIYKDIEMTLCDGSSHHKYTKWSEQLIRVIDRWWVNIQIPKLC